MKHIMMDLETFGKTPGCAIRSIGAVEFELEGPVGRTFYRNIRGMSCWIAGLSVDKNTIDWWDRQSQDARDRLKVDQLDLVSVVDDFHRWFNETGAQFVWCQGLGFDEPIWQAASTAVGRSPPWKFWNTRCTRTIYHVSGLDPKTIPRDGVAHSALDDAEFQVRCVQAAHEKLQKKGE